MAIAMSMSRMVAFRLPAMEAVHHFHALAWPPRRRSVLPLDARGLTTSLHLLRLLLLRLLLQLVLLKARQRVHQVHACLHGTFLCHFPLDSHLIPRVLILFVFEQFRNIY